MHGGSGDVGASVLRSKERGFCSVVRFLSKWRWDQGLLYFPLLGSGDAVAGAPSGPLLPPTWLPSSFSSSLGCWKLSTEVDRMGMCGLDGAWSPTGSIQALAKARWGLLKGVSGRDHIPVHVGAIYLFSISLSQAHHSPFTFGCRNTAVQQILTHPVDDYDITLRLGVTALPQYAQNVRPDAAVLTRLPASSDTDTSLSALRVGFDRAVMLFDKLRVRFSVFLIRPLRAASRTPRPVL